MDKNRLESTAKKLVAKSKGILAADESSGTIKKRLDSISVESTEDSRRNYRQMLFEAEGLENYISGVILFDETIRQKTSDEKRLVDILNDKGIIPGIKVDMGAKDLAFFPGEKVTEGLTGLRERFEQYNSLGAGFSKWRAVIELGDKIPTNACIESNAHALARYAALSQEAGIVPIVEPEVLMTGLHSIEEHTQVTKKTLKVVFEQLTKYRIHIPGMLLKPNMVAAGLDRDTQSTPQEVATATLAVFQEVLPDDLPGVVFLSGGLSPDEATKHLSALNQKRDDLPWELSYSFGRALQGEALKAWGGKVENVAAAQKALIERSEKVSRARDGEAA